jgi:acyl-CoA thioester hydrolase
MPRVRLKVRYELYNEEQKLINTGHTWLGFLDGATRRPCRVPEYVIEKMRALGLEE